MCHVVVATQVTLYGLRQHVRRVHMRKSTRAMNKNVDGDLEGLDDKL